MEFCTNCGQKMAEGSSFCPECGARVEPAPPQKEYLIFIDKVFEFIAKQRKFFITLIVLLMMLTSYYTGSSTLVLILLFVLIAVCVIKRSDYDNRTKH